MSNRFHLTFLFWNLNEKEKKKNQSDGIWTQDHGKFYTAL